MPDNKSLSIEFGAKPELKKYMKKVMPFVQMSKEKVTQKGIQAINLTMDFDEMDVIKKNLDYLTYTLEVKILDYIINNFTNLTLTVLLAGRHKCFVFRRSNR